MKMVTETAMKSETALVFNGPPEPQQEVYMNDGGVSQTLETTDRKMEVLSTKTKTRLGPKSRRPKITWRQTVEAKLKKFGHTLGISYTTFVKVKAQGAGSGVRAMSAFMTGRFRSACTVEKET